MPSVPNLTTNVLLRSEETGGHVSVTEIVVPPHSAGPPLHRHDFDEASYMLDGELIFQVEDALVTKGAGELSFAPRNVPHSQPRGRARALRARLHARGLRAPLGAHGRRGGRGRAAAMGAAADPRGHRRRPADRAAGVRPRLRRALQVNHRVKPRWSAFGPLIASLQERRFETVARFEHSLTRKPVRWGGVHLRWYAHGLVGTDQRAGLGGRIRDRLERDRRGAPHQARGGEEGGTSSDERG